MSDHISNESSVSSHRSSVSKSDAELPILVAVQEHLPTFAKAAAIQLPRVVIPDNEDPPLFRLSAATRKLEQEHPPISPRTAEVLLCTHPDINEAIHAVTYSLIAMIHRRTLHASQELDESHTREQQVCQQLTTQRLEITHLQGRLGVVDIPSGFK